MEERKYTYPREEKLKSKVVIDAMFTEGKSVAKYPLRLVYLPLQDTEAGNIQMGVSVSKKYFKKAAERNYYKRLLREAYRLNKHMLIEKLNKPYAFMFFYQTKDKLTFEDINSKTVQLFEKFALQENLQH